jgi:hypothetical protein
MNSQSVNGGSLQLADSSCQKTQDVRPLSEKSSFGNSCPVEIIDAIELASRWNVPVSWIRAHTRHRTLDEIPHLKLGRYTRFRWGSAELERWLSSHNEGR